MVDGLNLTLDDVGCRIKLVYTPVRKDGATGTPKLVVSDVIEDGIFDQTTLLNIICFLGNTIACNIMNSHIATCNEDDTKDSTLCMLCSRSGWY